jgi:sphinganine C4-monooxygenase
MILQFTVIAPVTALAVRAMRWRISDSDGNDNIDMYTGGSRDLAVFALSYALAEASTWCIHRAMHSNRFLWRHIHRYHHRYADPSASSTIYAHPLELILVDILPFAIGPLVAGCSPAVFSTVAVAGTLNALLVHSGYQIYYDMGHHDHHHKHMDSHFSGIFSDTLMGTCARPDVEKYVRHRMDSRE